MTSPACGRRGVEDLTLAEHERIVDAIAGHDGQAAEQAMRDHLLRANALYRQLDAAPVVAAAKDAAENAAENASASITASTPTPTPTPT